MSRLLSEAAQARAALIMSVSVVGCISAGRRGEKKKEVFMSEEIITTKTGVYGRVNVVLPMPVKEQMYSWMQKSSMKKSQFFRTALMIGTVQLAQQLGIKEKTDDHFLSNGLAIAQQPTHR